MDVKGDFVGFLVRGICFVELSVSHCYQHCLAATYAVVSGMLPFPIGTAFVDALGLVALTGRIFSIVSFLVGVLD